MTHFAIVFLLYCQAHDKKKVFWAIAKENLPARKAGPIGFRNEGPIAASQRSLSEGVQLPQLGEREERDRERERERERWIGIDRIGCMQRKLHEFLLSLPSPQREGKLHIIKCNGI